MESRAPLLSSRAAAYLNMDVAVCGEGFQAASTPQLDDVIRDVSKRVSEGSYSPATMIAAFDPSILIAAQVPACARECMCFMSE